MFFRWPRNRIAMTDEALERYTLPTPKQTGLAAPSGSHVPLLIACMCVCASMHVFNWAYLSYQCAMKLWFILRGISVRCELRFAFLHHPGGWSSSPLVSAARHHHASVGLFPLQCAHNVLSKWAAISSFKCYDRVLLYRLVTGSSWVTLCRLRFECVYVCLLSSVRRRVDTTLSCIQGIEC